jgi:lysozyme
VIEVPQAAIDLAKRFEGFERKVKRGIEITAVPYICPAGFWTIGYGHLCDPKHPPITEAEAEVYLARDLQSALAATLRYCPVLATEPEGRLAAIVDFTFNLGRGGCRRRRCGGGSISETGELVDLLQKCPHRLIALRDVE